MVDIPTLDIEDYDPELNEEQETIEDLAKQLTESSQNENSETILEESLENIAESLNDVQEEDE